MVVSMWCRGEYISKYLISDNFKPHTRTHTIQFQMRIKCMWQLNASGWANQRWPNWNRMYIHTQTQLRIRHNIAHIELQNTRKLIAKKNESVQKYPNFINKYINGYNNLHRRSKSGWWCNRNRLIAICAILSTEKFKQWNVLGMRLYRGRQPVFGTDLNRTDGVASDFELNAHKMI